MNLLVRSARSARRLATPDVVFTAGVMATLACVEVLGRLGSSDLHDLIALAILAMLGVAVAARQRRSPLRWAAALGRGVETLGAWLRRRTFEIGLDLRGDPPVRRGVPPIVLVLAVGLAAWALLAAYFTADCPHGLRVIANRGSYLVYLGVLVAVWMSAILLTLLAAFLPAAMIHDAFVAAHARPGPRPRRAEFLALACYFIGLLALGTLLPVGVSLLLCMIYLAGYLTLCRLPARAAVRFLWRPTGSVRVRSLSWSQWVTWEFLLITLAVLAIVLTTCGDRLWGSPPRPEAMPITALLGMTLAWLAPGALGALLLQMALGRLRDPAREARPTAFVSGIDGAERRRSIRDQFARHGWSVRFPPERPQSVDVGIVFVDEPRLGGSDASAWPLVVLPGDLDDPAFWERIRRRNEVQLRRKLLSALERLFKLAAARPKQSGSGYWVAPHFWFVPGLMRDSQREADETMEFGDQSLLTGAVGPPYHRLVPRAVRHHLWRILRALQVDLVFVEDGVSFRRLRRVLRVLFEVYDIHAGRRPVNEIDFRGLPGVRVLIHEFQFDEPFKSEVYPEPKYDYLGRARILHVFRDRGGHEELIEPPFDASRTPAPMSAV